MRKVQRRPVSDPGIDVSARDLTPDQIENVITRVLERESSGRLKAFVETCIHCGLCSEACHLFLAYDRDPSYAPVAKVRQTLWDMIRRRYRVDSESLKMYARIAYAECNICKRCSMYCPFGIDMAYLMTVVRRICGLLGVVPQYLQDQGNSHMYTYSQAWIAQDDWADTVLWLEDELRMDVRNGRIPFDKVGAEIMYSPHSLEAKFKTNLLANIAKIMNVAGVDWTMPSCDGWDSTNQAMHIGDYETMGMVERMHFEAAMRLKVKKIMTSECGHSFRAAVYDGSRWLGWKKPPITYLQPTQFFYELIRDGKLRIARKIEGPVTVQDPCSIVRNRGMGEMLRYIVRATCDEFRDVTPRLEHNYCCTAGGGVINYGPPWKFIRMEGGRVKMRQLQATGAKIVIAPCHSCHKTIEELIHHYNADMHVMFISELLVQTMEIPEALRVYEKSR